MMVLFELTHHVACRAAGTAASAIAHLYHHASIHISLAALSFPYPLSSLFSSLPLPCQYYSHIYTLFPNTPIRACQYNISVAYLGVSVQNPQISHEACLAPPPSLARVGGYSTTLGICLPFFLCNIHEASLATLPLSS